MPQANYDAMMASALPLARLTIMDGVSYCLSSNHQITYIRAREMLKTMLGLELMAMLENVVPGAPDAAEKMVEIRTLVHGAAQSNTIPVSEWRVLIEKSVAMQKEFTWRR